MKKYLLMLLALCGMAFTACSDDDDNDDRRTPQISPNNTDLIFSSGADSREISVTNAVDLNIVKINQKSGSATTASTETNVYVYGSTDPKLNKLKNPKYVTESGWLTARVVTDASGRDSRIVFSVSKYTPSDQQSGQTDKARDWYVHVTCGGVLYGIVFHIVQNPPTSKQ